MGLNDRVNKKARERLEGQVMPGETVRLSSNLAASALVLTDRRVMIAPALSGSEPEINVPLRAVTNVAWKKGILGSPGLLTITTAGANHVYKVRNNDGENAAQQIRQAIAAAM
jgi:hypothetical protein